MMHAHIAGAIQRNSNYSNEQMREAADLPKSPSLFLTAEDVITLTGRKLKSLQVDALRRMGIPFFINAIGRPVVARTVIDGKQLTAPQEKSPWVPPGLRRK